MRLLPRSIDLSVHVNSIENDVSKAAGKIQQIRLAFREAHDTLTNFVCTTANTNILGITNTLRITQKVPFSPCDIPLCSSSPLQTIDQRAHITDIVDSGNLLAPMPVPHFESYQPPRSYNKGRGHSQRNYLAQSRHVDSYHSGRDPSFCGSPGSDSRHGDRRSANKRRRYWGLVDLFNLVFFDASPVWTKRLPGCVFPRVVCVPNGGGNSPY